MWRTSVKVLIPANRVSRTTISLPIGLTARERQAWIATCLTQPPQDILFDYGRSDIAAQVPEEAVWWVVWATHAVVRPYQQACEREGFYLKAVGVAGWQACTVNLLPWRLQGWRRQNTVYTLWLLVAVGIGIGAAQGSYPWPRCMSTASSVSEPPRAPAIDPDRCGRAFWQHVAQQVPRAKRVWVWTEENPCVVERS